MDPGFGGKETCCLGTNCCNLHISDLRLDFCRFGTDWRKRAKFRTSFCFGGIKLFCICDRPHVRLRGRCKEKKIAYTKLAEAYPRRLCAFLAIRMLQNLSLLPRTRKLDIATCAKCNKRVGEAQHPGPRNQPRVHRADVHLAEVELLEPATI